MSTNQEIIDHLVADAQGKFMQAVKIAKENTHEELNVIMRHDSGSLLVGYTNHTNHNYDISLLYNEYYSESGWLPLNAEEWLPSGYC